MESERERFINVREMRNYKCSIENFMHHITLYLCMKPTKNCTKKSGVRDVVDKKVIE
jgi:hypothetical protein